MYTAESNLPFFQKAIYKYTALMQVAFEKHDHRFSWYISNGD